MLKIIKNKPNLLPNISKLKDLLDIQFNVTIPNSVKYGLNTVTNTDVYKFNFIIRTNKNYKVIEKEMNFKLLTIDDFRWIDENVYDDPKVPS